MTTLPQEPQRLRSNLLERPLLQKHMPELDILRGFAILVVVVYHGLYWSSAVSPTRLGTFVIQASVFGWLGVNLFFVLSGFLITGILLDSKGRKDFYRRFYLRRVFRILPVYWLMIAIMLLVGHLTLSSAAVSFFFLVNYSGELSVAGNYGAFWSLSVEEQFYLLWPMLVANVSRRTFTAISIGICLVEPVLRWLVATGHIPFGGVRDSTWLIADNLALGALAALFARSRYGTLRNGIFVGGSIIAAGVLILVAGLPFGILHRTNVFGATLQAVPWNLMFTGVLLLMLGLRSPFWSSLYAAPMRFLGYISYGLYLCHLLVFEAYDRLVMHLSMQPLKLHLQGAFTRLLIAGLLAVFVSWLSRRFYEDRFLRIKI